MKLRPASSLALSVSRIAWPLLAAVVLIGCGESGGPAGGAPEAPSGPTAAGVLQQMRKAYADAPAYSDDAQFVQEIVAPGENIRRPLPIMKASVRFERPNKLRFGLLQSTPGRGVSAGYDVACDGQNTLSRSVAIGDQIHVSAAPATLTTENFLPSELLRNELLDDPLPNTHAPLAMLLGFEGDLFPEEASAELVGEATVADAACHVVLMKSDEGERKLWIDQANGLLHKMELPVDKQRERLVEQGVITELRVWIDFENAGFDTPDPASFTMAPREGSFGVSRFVKGPPEPPAAELGQPAGAFAFLGLDGEEVTPATLSGKVTLMDFWFTGCPPCRAQAPVLQEVYDAFASDDRVRMLAVSTDSQRITDEKVERTLREWGNNMPIVRDLQQDAYELLNVRATPTMILLGQDGRVQAFDLGVHPEAEPLIEEVRHLLEGGDLAAEAQAEYAALQEAYEQELAEARVPLPQQGLAEAPAGDNEPVN